MIRSFFTVASEGPLYFLWGAAGAVLWITLVDWYVKEPRVAPNWSKPWSLFVTFFPALAILTICFGLYAGKNGTRLYTRPMDVQVVLKDQKTPVMGRLLFLLDDYAVLRDQETGNVVAISKLEITKLHHASKDIVTSGSHD